MNQWQFSIVDYTQVPNGHTTNIDEPIGWDDMMLHLKRDEKWHGFFSYQDDSFSSLQYDGQAADILRKAYYTQGVQARVELHIAYDCDESDSTSNTYLGTFDFTTFIDYTSDRCYVECATIVSQALYLLKNRADQQVDLDNLASFDQLPVQQTVSGIAAEFEASIDIVGESFGAIRVNVLMNGLLAGSKIKITGSVNNNKTFTVASAKPDYTNVNPDLAGGATTSNTFSCVFDANNSTISLNQLVNLSVGTQITCTAPDFLAGPGYPAGSVFDNSGVYQITSIQQHFNYTVLTVKLISIANSTNVPNYGQQPPAGNGTPATGAYMVTQSADGVVFTAQFITTAQPTATIITVAEIVTTESVQGNPGGNGISVTGFWLKNNMKPYTGLGQIVTIPAKNIIATTLYKNAQEMIVDFGLTKNVHAGIPNGGASFITPSFPNVVSDIDESDVGTDSPVLGALNSPSGNPPNTPPDTIIFFRQGTLACSGKVRVKYNISYKWEKYDGSDPQNYIVEIGSALEIKAGTDPKTASNTPPPFIVDAGMHRSSFPMNDFTTISGEGDADFPAGTYLWFWFFANITNNVDSFYPKLVIAPESFIQITLESQCAQTPCASYLINESLSRCSEAYTNGAMQVYSDYFGRKNAQPIASSQDGCGGVAAITNGLRVRGCIMPDNSAIPKFFTTLQEMFESLDAIHNIGMGMEPDPNRAGFNRLRIEPFKWFFQNNVLLTCDKIFKYTRESLPSLLCSAFQVGYLQFETWNNNGLYDIYGSREYRTPLNHLTNIIQKLCKWMASDYAIEFARRQFGITTSDGRYDSYTFILQLINQYFGDVEMVKSCMLNWYFDGITHVTNLNDQITITDSAHNNLTGFVTNISPCHLGGQLNYIFLTTTRGGNTPVAFVNEFNESVQIHNDTQGYFYNNNFNFPCFFIGPNGGIMLDSLDLFNAKQGDKIDIFVPPVFGGGVYTIDEIFSPILACNILDCEENFPMAIFPITPITMTANPFYELIQNCPITNLNNQFYAVEQGMENGVNILSPETVMNARISPARNAMRHFINIISDRNFANQFLSFTGGKGNFYALTQLSDACTPENDLISEGGNISLSNFTKLVDGEPLFYAELVKFDFPLTWAQFLKIQANPYGLVNFQHTNEGMQQGWIVDIQYKPYTGMASFQLYPKIPASAFKRVITR